MLNNQLRSHISVLPRAFIQTRHSSQQSWRDTPPEPIDYDSDMHAKIAPHTLYALLRDPIRPTEFPSRKTTTIQRGLQLRLSKWGGIVNHAWMPWLDSAESSSSLTIPDPSRSTALIAFSRLGRLDIPSQMLEDPDAVATVLQRHAFAHRELEELAETSRPGGAPSKDRESLKLRTEAAREQNEVQIYVCTHGARDCRCGVVGERVARALREEVKRRGLDGGGDGLKVRVGEVGHIGGHKLGRVEESDAPRIIEAVQAVRPVPVGLNGSPYPLKLWRGRTGLSLEEMQNVWARGPEGPS